MTKKQELQLRQQQYQEIIDKIDEYKKLAEQLSNDMLDLRQEINEEK